MFSEEAGKLKRHVLAPINIEWLGSRDMHCESQAQSLVKRPHFIFSIISTVFDSQLVHSL